MQARIGRTQVLRSAVVQPGEEAVDGVRRQPIVPSIPTKFAYSTVHVARINDGHRPCFWSKSTSPWLRARLNRHHQAQAGLRAGGAASRLRFVAASCGHDVKQGFGKHSSAQLLTGWLMPQGLKDPCLSPWGSGLGDFQPLQSMPATERSFSGTSYFVVLDSSAPLSSGGWQTAIMTRAG